MLNTLDAREACPLCRQQHCRVHSSSPEGLLVECKCSGFFLIDRISFTIGQKGELDDKAYLLRAYVAEYTSLRKDTPQLLGKDGIEKIVAACPSRIEQKAHKLLSRLIAISPYFNAQLKVAKPALVLYAYAVNIDEAAGLLSYLQELRYLQMSWDTDHVTIFVRAPGYEALERRKLLSPLSVFISSTCYDLVDLRSALAAALETAGCTVRLSEDPERFAVDPTGDSIASCLRNLESSDIVVCIIDRRYGGIINNATYANLSATHAEIRHANSEAVKKPVLYYMRDRAWNDYDLLRRDATIKTQWVEQRNDAGRAAWLGMVSEIAALPEHNNRSNWVTLFKTSVDLCPLAVKQVADFFAGQPRGR